MKKIICIVISIIIFCVTSAVYCSAAIDSLEFDEINAQHLMGKTNCNVSLYGDDLEDNMVTNAPVISQFRINDNMIMVNGLVNSWDNNTSFCLQGKVYKTYDGNIVCNASDTTGKYDVLFLCLEKKSDYNDYILLRDREDEQYDLKGDYGLKIYLLRKGTREISILEDTDVKVSNINRILVNAEETDYSCMNWFTNCFIPISSDTNAEDSVSPLSVITTGNFTYWDTEVYAIGSDRIYLGLQILATNTTPPVYDQTTFSCKIEYNPIADSTNPAYANPQRAADMFRVHNIGVVFMIGQGYFLQEAAWGAYGCTTPSLNPSLSFGISLSYGVVGGSISVQPSYYVPVTLGALTDLCGYGSSYPYSMPRRAQTFYSGLAFANTGDEASLSVRITNIPEISDKFACYQTEWTFDIHKKGAWSGYSYSLSDHVYCTSYFNVSF